MRNIIIKQGDITKEKVCAIVNAANASLLGGGGVDGAIHRAGGKMILDQCKHIRAEQYPDGLPTGEVVTTSAGMMPSKYVIHTVGPIYSQCGHRCEALLHACYTNAMQKALEIGCKSIAFPAISTGVYGYPEAEAAKIAFHTIKTFIEKDDTLQVHLLFHSKKSKETFLNAIDDI